jgi:hypothetical protein
LVTEGGRSGMPKYKFFVRVDAHYGWDNVYTNGSDHLLSDGNWHQFYPGVERDMAIDYDIWDHKYRKKLKGQLVFMNNQIQTDYTLLSQIFNMSAEVNIRIEQSCTTTASDWWEGYFSIIDGEWNADRGLFAVTPTVDDVYRHFEEQGDKKYNLMSLGHTEQESFNVATTLVQITVNNPTWYAAGHAAFEAFAPNYPNTIRSLTGDSWAFYARCDDPNPETQLLIWKKYVSPIKLNSSYVYDTGDHAFSLKSCTAGSDILLSARGIFLRDVLQYMVNDIDGLNFKSSFMHLDVWPDGTAYSDHASAGKNYVTLDTNKLDRLILYQKSDVKPTSDPATKGEITFNEMMQSLKDMFNVDWFINTEGSDYVFRIEHWSYFELATTTASDIDLTTLDGGKWANHMNKWAYEIQEMPNTERFRWMEAYDVDFWGKDILYDRIATFNRYKDNIKERQVPFTTDVAYVYSTPDAISNEGWVLLQTNASDYIENEVGIISGLSVVNGHLSWANLHNKYWRHGRVIENGNMNGSDVVFESWQRNIKQTEITYPECCGEFDPLAYKITGLGEGLPRAGQYKLSDGTVKSVFFYLDIAVMHALKTGFPIPETYHLSIDGHFDLMIDSIDKLIWYG